MTAIPEILTMFAKWAKSYDFPTATDADVGIADQEMEDVAWFHFQTPNTFPAIKLWSSGHYYIEILTLQLEAPLLAEFGDCNSQWDFSAEFERLFEAVAAYEKSIGESGNAARNAGTQSPFRGTGRVSTVQNGPLTRVRLSILKAYHFVVTRR